MRVLRFAFFCSAGAVVASLCAITLSARIERKSLWQPINASSHWLWGEEAGQRRRPDIRHTTVGGATNILAAAFWGSLFGVFISRHRRPVASQIIRDASAMGAFAGLLDYGLLPKRLRPGWEHALSSRSVVISMASMALGLAVGGIAARRTEDDSLNCLRGRAAGGFRDRLSLPAP